MHEFKVLSACFRFGRECRNLPFRTGGGLTLLAIRWLDPWRADTVIIHRRDMLSRPTSVKTCDLKVCPGSLLDT